MAAAGGMQRGSLLVLLSKAGGWKKAVRFVTCAIFPLATSVARVSLFKDGSWKEAVRQSLLNAS